MNENVENKINQLEIELNDVPSPIDLRNPDEALQWANEVNLKRPWRYKFFDDYAQYTLKHAPMGHVLELGAGPGFLAKHLLENCPHIQYTAFDFSEAMHELSKSKLITLDMNRATFITGNFKQAHWAEQLKEQSTQPCFDVIIIHQALHELRHKRYATAFHQGAKILMHEQTVYFVCDHIFAPEGQQNSQLYMSVGEHLEALRNAGFEHMECVQQIKGMALFKAKL